MGCRSVLLLRLRELDIVVRLTGTSSDSRRRRDSAPNKFVKGNDHSILSMHFLLGSQLGDRIACLIQQSVQGNACGSDSDIPRTSRRQSANPPRRQGDGEFEYCAVVERVGRVRVSALLWHFMRKREKESEEDEDTKVDGCW
jgi:hypothetical protein